MGALTRPLKALQGGGLLVALLVAPTSVLAGEKDIPGHPVIESVENCKAYKEDVYQALHAQFQKELSCISSTSADISYGAECNDLTGQVSTGLHAWPHCQDAEYHCALVRASADADQCPEQSRAQSSRSSGTDKVLSDIIEADALVGEINAYPAFVTDPEGYIREKIADKLSEENKRKFVDTVFDTNGRLNPYGIEATDQFYDWGFKKMTQSSTFMSENPIIRAIQSESFEALGSMQQQMLGEMQGLRKTIKEMGDAYPRPGKTSTVTGSSKQPAAASECAVLNDGVRASNLSIDHPEQFAALIQKCGG